ncbi:MAG: cytochrome-c oxidase, cbb3-type subunit III [Deltaproteobacteria bacterium]|nr:cytochrome-c oxidase, cbb3-type subunit III [Deltaproteobacteria bacterium]MBW2387399.1 cytochrome-c oxidase, cbb3-type subunit III [Deltaproteobacteria bacterium]MBW2724655.1 cytochrome-c oxidase, cbb3-type subunit III [Deltaproteobacteria bacterium]
MSTGWSLYIDALVVLCLAGCAWLLWVNRTAPIDKVGKGEPLEADHDGIRELNNPLPAWWTWLFVLTIVYAVIYLAFYPGMGSYAGLLGWTSQGQHEAEVQAANARYGPIFASYAAQPIPALLNEHRAVEIGSRLFLNHCATCHGSDARGSKGYPNLTDDDWLYGGAPETIVTTITNGRMGNMPPMGVAVGGDAQVKALAQYVLSLSGRDHDDALAKQAAGTFATLCAVCHTKEGTGNPVVGAPNLTDDIWLHGGRVADIEAQIHTGRISQMPAHGNLLSKEKIHLLATYVYSLSNEPQAAGGNR